MEGSIWDYLSIAKAIVIPTNGFVVNGKNIMKEGLSLEAKQRYPALPQQIGLALRFKLLSAPVYKDHKNDVILFHFNSKPDYAITRQGLRLPGFKGKADLELIRNAARQLNNQINTFQYYPVIIPRVGCGCGGLSWEKVKKVLKETGLYDNPRVHFISNE